MEKKITKYKGDVIHVKGFKSISQETSIEIRPLTILSGANNSGKSSIMQPLLLLKQTLETPFDPGTLLLHGPNVRITSASQLLSKISPKVTTDKFYFSYQSRNDWMLKLCYKNVPKKGFDIENMIFKSENQGDLTLKPDMTIDLMEIGSILSKAPNELKNLFRNIKKKSRELTWEISRNRCFLNAKLKYKEEAKAITFLRFDPGSDLEEEIENLIHVPALRGNPERTYKTTAVGDKFPGTFQEYVASIINHWQTTKSKKLELLGNALENLGLTWKVEAYPIDDTQVEMRVARFPHRSTGTSKDLVNIADVGFGLSQILPVIVAILVAKPNQIVYLEEPEIHLHPKAQLYLPNILIDAAKRKVKVVVETHSSLLLKGLQSIVANGYFQNELTKLHWFKRNDLGETEVFSADFDKYGAFGDWPEDFDNINLYSEKTYLDAVEKRMIH